MDNMQLVLLLGESLEMRLGTPLENIQAQPAV